MTSKPKDLILRVLDEHRVMTIATNRPDGWPQATMVGYVNDGFMIYCFVARNAQKYANILRDPRVSIAIGSRRAPNRGFLPWRFSDAGRRSPPHRLRTAGIRKPSHSRPFGPVRRMSELPSIADIARTSGDVRVVPTGDVPPRNASFDRP